jgi:hypothetical protein
LIQHGWNPLLVASIMDEFCHDAAYNNAALGGFIGNFDPDGEQQLQRVTCCVSL